MPAGEHGWRPIDLEKYLHEQIPASLALGISVKDCSKDQIELMAPLSANLNHKNTAFGGSISVIAILAGWALVFLRLQGMQIEIVIQDSAISYLQAVKSDFSAISNYNESLQWSRLIPALKRHGKGRVLIQSDVYCNGEIVAQHSGSYVAINKQSA